MTVINRSVCLCARRSVCVCVNISWHPSAAAAAAAHKRAAAAARVARLFAYGTRAFGAAYAPHLANTGFGRRALSKHTDRLKHDEHLLNFPKQILELALSTYTFAPSKMGQFRLNFVRTFWNFCNVRILWY